MTIEEVRKLKPGDKIVHFIWKDISLQVERVEYISENEFYVTCRIDSHTNPRIVFGLSPRPGPVDPYQNYLVSE